MSDFQKLLLIMFLKAAPQDLSHSVDKTARLAFAYILSGVIVLQTTINPDNMLLGIFFGLAVQFSFVYLVLNALQKKPRFVQTFFAILGVSLFFNCLSWPVFSVLADEASSESLQSSMSLFFLMLISWEVLVKAHIFKHALEMKMFSAMALSFSLFFISVALSQLLIPK